MKHPTRSIGRIFLALVAAIVCTATAHATVPARPVNLALKQLSENGQMARIIVTWEDGDSNPAGFRIYHSSNGGTSFRIRNQRSGETPSPHTEYVGPLPDGTHHIYVTAFNADGESLPSDTLAITLDARMYDNMVEGTLVDTAGTPLYGLVIGYRLDGDGRIIDSAYGAAYSGTFKMSELPAGTYLFWAFAYDSTHVPGYHVDGAVAASSWTGGTRVTVAEDDTTSGVDITLVFMSGYGGSGRVSGRIESDPGRTSKGDDEVVLGAPVVSGATIYALDKNGSVAGVGMTDTNGRFTISNLYAGAYTLMADKIGFKPLSIVVEVSENQNTTADIQIHSTTSTVVIAEPVVTDLSVYPNPIVGEGTVRFTARAGVTRMRLVDMNGREAFDRTIESGAGETSMRLETSGLAVGVYVLHIGEGSSAVSRMVTVTR